MKIDVSWNFSGSIKRTMDEIKKDRQANILWLEHSDMCGGMDLSIDDAYELVNQLERKLAEIRAAEQIVDEKS